jgi:hypothetical protein
MSHPPITPEERFATIVEALLSNPDVTPPVGWTPIEEGVRLIWTENSQ